MTPPLLKPRSHALVDGPNRAGARSMLRACGLKDDDFAKPLIGVANTWIEIGPCNYHLRELAADVKAGIRAAGGTPLEFNTVSISDGITMGTEGMRTSLVSREVIADSIELVTRGNMFDAIVILVGCDKTIPGGIMAAARLNVPALVLYGGSIAPGQFVGECGVPRGGRLRWTIYRQHHGAGRRIPRHCADGAFRSPGNQSGEAQCRTPRR